MLENLFQAVGGHKVVVLDMAAVEGVAEDVRLERDYVTFGNRPGIVR